MPQKYIQTHSGEGAEALEKLFENTDYDSVESLIKATSAVGASVIDAQKRLGLSIIFLHQDGRKWLFDVNEPGKALPIDDNDGPKPPRKVGNVIHFDFGKKS